MSFVAVAIGGSAALGLWGASKAAGAAKEAASTQSEAALSAAELEKQARDEALAEQKRQFDIGQENLAPWLEAGRTRLTDLMAGTEPGGDLMRSFTQADFKEDPGYQFRLSEGEKAINRSLAARGRALSGRGVKEALRYSSGLASQEYGNAWSRFKADQTDRYNRLASIAGVGQTTASGLAGLGADYASGITNTMLGSARSIGDMQTAAANARASGYIGSGNAWNSAIGNIGNSIMSIPSLLSAFGGGGNTPYISPSYNPMPAGWNTLPY